MYKTNSQWSVYKTFLPNCSWATGCLTLPILSLRPSLPPFRVSASHLRDEDVWVLFSAWTSCPPPESWFFVPHCLLGPFLSAQLAACSVGVLDSLLPELPLSFLSPSASYPVFLSFVSIPPLVTPPSLLAWSPASAGGCSVASLILISQFPPSWASWQRGDLH